MIVDSNTQDALGIILPDHIFIETRHDLARRRQTLEIEITILALIGRILLKENPLAQFDTAIADKHPIGSRD
jgi:hypothetical protein